MHDQPVVVQVRQKLYMSEVSFSKAQLHDVDVDLLISYQQLFDQLWNDTAIARRIPPQTALLSGHKYDCHHLLPCQNKDERTWKIQEMLKNQTRDNEEAASIGFWFMNLPMEFRTRIFSH